MKILPLCPCQEFYDNCSGCPVRDILVHQEELERRVEELLMNIKNVNQKVSDGYYNNPFWEKHKEPPLDYEQELVAELNKCKILDPDILLDALEYLGWTKLVQAWEALEEPQ
jgi:hypothetical protein